LPLIPRIRGRPLLDISYKGVCVVSERSLDVILAEWRALEQRLLAEGDEDIAAELAALRDEYATAFAARRREADELGRAPGMPASA
jgi:hypothetical protein